jgi:hypothetical protein
MQLAVAKSAERRSWWALGIAFIAMVIAFVELFQ